MDLTEIENYFKNEFGALCDKFHFGSTSLLVALSKVDQQYVKPGVYVFFQQEKGIVIKVGRSFENVHKRALEHVSDNTGGEMKEMGKETLLLFFTLKHKEDIHWTSALEVFLERKLDPKVKSKRTG